MFVPLRLAEEFKRVLDNVEDEVRKKVIPNGVSAILVLGSNKSTIKKADLTRLMLTGVEQLSWKYTNPMIIETNIELDKVFGMRLYELDDRARYLLVNSRADYSQFAKRKDSECDEFTVVYFMLLDIFASPEERVADSDMMDTLSALELTDKDLKKHVDTATKNLYVLLTKDTLNPELKYYTWGPRAMAEVDPDNFLRSFLETAPGTTEKDWPEQKRRIEKLKGIAFRYKDLVAESGST